MVSKQNGHNLTSASAAAHNSRADDGLVCTLLLSGLETLCLPRLPFSRRFWPVRKYPWGAVEAMLTQHSGREGALLARANSVHVGACLFFEHGQPRCLGQQADCHVCVPKRHASGVCPPSCQPAALCT